MADGVNDRPLVLWDVDHTLVVVGVSRALYELAFSAVVGRPLGMLADMVGRTERAIITETLELNQVTVSNALIDAFYTQLGIAADMLRDRMRETGRALAGAEGALRSLAGRAVQSVVTGNIRPVAVAKLAAFGLDGLLDLSVGGYGDDGSDRAELVRLARKRAEAEYGHVFPLEHTIVVGDTPRDVQGAHDAGCRALAVATGLSSIEELAACGADAVIADLTDLAALHAAICNATPA